MAARVRRAPRWVMLPERALRREIDRHEREALRLAEAGESCGVAFARLVKAWVVVERVYWDVREWNRRVRFKRMVLGDGVLRAELREALGGDAAMERWERAWEAEGREEGTVEGSGQAKGEANNLGLGSRFRGNYGEAESRRKLHGELRARFRLARRPGVARKGAGSLGPCLRRGERKKDRGGFRIPVWPEELRAEAVCEETAGDVGGVCAFRGRERFGDGAESEERRGALRSGLMGSASAVGCRSP